MTHWRVLERQIVATANPPTILLRWDASRAAPDAIPYNGDVDMAERREIRAGADFDKALHEDPVARAAWERVRMRFLILGELLTATGPALAEERERVLSEVTDTIREAVRTTDPSLESAGIETPQTIEEWEQLAHVVGMPFVTIRSGNFTLAEVRNVSLAWIKRERLRALLAGGSGSTPALPATESPESLKAPPLTQNAVIVLCTMARFDASVLLGATRIEQSIELTDRLSARTIGPLVRRLVSLGLAERPEGLRSGARLTVAGRRLATNITG